jgi:hypothetical protein
MSYSLCRFWAYDESKKIIGAGESSSRHHYVNSPPLLAIASLWCIAYFLCDDLGLTHFSRTRLTSVETRFCGMHGYDQSPFPVGRILAHVLSLFAAGGIAGIVGNPGGTLTTLAQGIGIDAFHYFYRDSYGTR